ncbi:MAG: CHASE2 domain-containing protein [Pseudomonadota bacterium]
MSETTPQASELRSGLGLSRWVGLAIFGLFILVHIALQAGLDAPWRRLWFDTLAQAAPRERVEVPPAVIVAIDESSIRSFGQWPWSRDLLAILIARLKAAGVTAIGMDILFSEPDRLSPVRLAEWLGSADPALAEPVSSLGDTDLLFAQALTGANAVVPIAGISQSTLASFNNIGISPAVLREEILPGGMTQFENGIRALPVFQEAAAGHAAIAFDGAPDGIVRRVPAIQTIGGSDAILLGIETLRVGTGGFYSVIRNGDMGLELDLDTHKLPVERDGTFWMRFGQVDEARYIPAAPIMTGEVSEELEGKIVLLAVTGLGAVDTQVLPIHPKVWGVEVHLQMIEQILAQDFLRRPFEMYMLETALLAIFGLVLIQAIPRAPPVLSLATGGGAAVLLLGISYLAYRSGWLFDASSPVLGSVLTGVGLIGASLIERDRERLMERSEREAQERARDALLSAAKNMQQSVLPSPSFEVKGKVRLAAYLDPAYDVGGDLYDHFMLDGERIFFIVGDVSGKGVAACQFMGISKRLWKIVAQRMESNLSGIQTEANTQIALDNSEMLFVTGIAGVLDLNSGLCAYSSAGHDQPILLSRDTPAHQLDEFTGPPAGLIADMPYPVGEMVLKPGEKLVMFSDGVTEALNAGRDDYGMARLIAFLDRLPLTLTPAEVIERTVADIKAFVGDAEQSDDITLMVVERL